MRQRFRLNTFGLTHEGLVRPANEDSMILRDDAGVWVVADGMGGHENGRWASQSIVSQVERAALNGDFDRNLGAIAGAIHAANQDILATSRQSGQRMGSTVVALYLDQGRMACLWAGDSRIYLLRGCSLIRLTRDHTQVEDMVEAGLLRPDEAKGHPMAHVISRAVGVDPNLQLDAIQDEIEARDVFLLCSDGLTGVVSDDEIAEQLTRYSPSQACQRLLELCLSRGAPDNVTMVAVGCDEITALSLAGTDQ